MPSLTELRLIQALHGGFPLQERPFAAVGSALGLDEHAVIDSLRQLLDRGVLTRFGPLFQIERAGGRFVLAAMAVPPDRFDAVAESINALPEVAHNYRREHSLNMWFVVAAESQEQADRVLSHIEALTALKVLAFPKEREYFVELRLPLLHEGPIDQASVQMAAQPASAAAACPEDLARAGLSSPLSEFERELMRATQAGLPIVRTPYAEVGKQLHVGSQHVMDTLAGLLSRGVIRRIGAVPHHYRLGFVANGMSVWDVDDAEVDALGEVVGKLPGVSHCYRRPRHGTTWPYNLFAMLHGRSRDEVDAQAEQLRALLGKACRSSDILYSSAVLKKTGLRLRANAGPTAVEG